MTSHDEGNRRPDDADEAMDDADVANGEGPPDRADTSPPVNDAEERYGEDESPS